MRTIRLEKTGGPEVLELVEVPTPQPGPGEVLIRHEAIGLNFIETYQRSGLYPVKFPFPPGGEAAGVVEAIGEGVSRHKVGDRVATFGGSGAYADASVVAAERVARVPAEIDLRVAAAAILKGMTVEFLVRRTYPVQAGQTVLVHAAVGGVGQIMTQWLKAIGASVIATVGSESKAARARELGADHVILYRDQDVAAEVRRITEGKGVPVVYDSVGKDTLEGSLASLSRRGMMICYGNASGPAPPVSPLRLVQGGSLYLTRPSLFDYVTTPDELDESAGLVFEMIRSGKIKVEIGQTFALAEARKAHEALESRSTIGSSLLIP